MRVCPQPNLIKRLPYPPQPQPQRASPLTGSLAFAVGACCPPSSASQGGPGRPPSYTAGSATRRQTERVRPIRRLMQAYKQAPMQVPMKATMQPCATRPTSWSPLLATMSTRYDISWPCGCVVSLGQDERPRLGWSGYRVLQGGAGRVSTLGCWIFTHIFRRRG